jgi:hypothetical protein
MRVCGSIVEYLHSSVRPCVQSPVPQKKNEREEREREKKKKKEETRKEIKIFKSDLLTTQELCTKMYRGQRVGSKDTVPTLQELSTTAIQDEGPALRWLQAMQKVILKN